MFSKPTARIAALLATWVFVCAGGATAQTSTARLRIELHSVSGDPVGGATIALTDAAARDVARTSTTPDGRATFAALLPGRYDVTITASGFASTTIRALSLMPGLTATLPLILTTADALHPTEAVVVTGSAALLRTGAAETGRALDGDAMRAQPSIDRDVLVFAQQIAGVSPPAPGSRLSTQGNSAINSSGAREAANNFLLDGLDNNDWFLDRQIVNPSLDAIAAVAVRQNTYDAEFGRSAGARVDIQLRSGTSRLSGSAYEFYQPSPKHLFGGTLGGPLGTSDERSFFFVSAEGVSAREPDRRRARVPTMAERTGDFSASGLTITDPFTGRPFAGNVIPAARISAVSRAVAALYPQPNTSEGTINYDGSADATRAAGNATIKTDHRVGRDHQLSFRVSGSHDRHAFPYLARNRNLPGFGLDDLDDGVSAGGSLSQVVTPAVLHVLRAGASWSQRENLPGQHGTDGFGALGMNGPTLAGNDLAYPSILVAGLETLGDDANLPVVRRTRSLHVADTLTFERGRHQLKTGIEWRRYASDGDNHLFARGKISFSGAYTGQAFADLLLGFPSFALLAQNNNRQALRTWALDGFFQDTWRPSARLTIDAGLRYEVNAPPTDADNRMRLFDLTRLQLVDVGTNGISRSGIHSDLNNLAPRLAVGWDVTGRGRTIARAGYGIFYDAGTLIENSALYFNPPYFTLQMFVPTASAPLRIENPFPARRGIDPLTTVNSIDPSFRTGYAHQMSASLEHSVAGVMATARYVGAVGRNLVRKRNINQPVPGAGALDPRRPIAGFSDVLLVESQGRSSYHALQLSIDRPLADGLDAHAAYTWSRSLDDASAFLASDGNDNTPQDSRNIAAEWSPSDFDVRHRFVASLTWTAAGESLPAWLSGWRISALVSAQSGRPFTPRLSTDNSNTGNAAGATFASDRPNVLTGTAAVGQATWSYGDVTFVVPPRYTFGNAGRNMLRGPGYAAVDGLLARTFHLTGARTLELRGEIFNIFNRRNGQLPDSFVDHATFGQVLATYPARQWQVAVRFGF